MNVHNLDFFQIQGDFRTAASHLLCNLPEMLRPRDRSGGRSFVLEMSSFFIFFCKVEGSGSRCEYRSGNSAGNAGCGRSENGP